MTGGEGAGGSRGSGSQARTTAGNQVVVGSIPAPQPGFQLRRALAAQLNRVGGGRPVVLTGPRGAGKTQLAAADARAKLVAGWRLVAWVSAGNLASLQAGLAAVADAVGLSGAGSRRGTAGPGQLVRDWLEADGDRCLLVFDDAHDPDVLRPFVPVGGAARVLITADREAVADLGTRVRVGAFSAEETLALLYGRTGLADGDGALAVAVELGYLPLALDQAAVVIAGQHLEYRAYLDRLRASARQHLTGSQEQQYPPGVPEAVLLSVVAVDDPAGVGAGVLEMMAVLSAAGVRRELIHAAGQAGVLARGKRVVQVDRAVVDEALARLAEGSLLAFSLNGQTVMAHCLTLAVVRDGLSRQGRLAPVCRAVAEFLDAYAAMIAGSPDRAAVRDIPEQVMGLQENMVRCGVQAGDQMAMLLLSLRLWALYQLNDLGDSAPQAVAVGEPLVADFEQMFGRDHPDTLNAQNSLALAYLGAGRAAEAIPLFEQALVAQERLHGPDHAQTLTSQGNLATAYLNAGRIGEAILHFELVLTIRQRALGPDHPDTLNSASGLAAAYTAAGRPDEAILLLELVLPAREWLLGTDHPITVNTQTNLAGAYRDAGQLAEAIPLFEQALANRERLLGADHPSTRTARDDLALAFRAADQAQAR